MAKRAKKAQRNQEKLRRNHTPPKRRRVYILPYLIMAALIVGIPLGIYQLYVSNTNRAVDGLETAIREYDTAYLEEKTDRLPIILDVLKTSYSENSSWQNDFYNNNFKNLSIEVIDSASKRSGKEVKVNVSNVNYIDVYDKVPESKTEEEIHNDYMAALGDPNQERNTREATLYLERNFNGYDIYESKEFINAILGGALEYADDLDANTTSNNNQADQIDEAMGNN